MASAEEFFARLRARVAARTEGKPLGPAPLGPVQTEPTRERFFEELALIGAITHETDRAHAPDRVLAIASAKRCGSFVAWQDGLVAELGVAPYLVDAHLQQLGVLEGRRADREELARADLVIAGCDAAFAENGALLMCAAASRGRLLTALPRVQIALVGRSQLVHGLEALPALLRQMKLPSAALLHTGPTFSGDIEAIVVVGAHGPAEVHVVWVDDA